jgi:beta-lactamase superfamily II metal-dependent hydrolase
MAPESGRNNPDANYLSTILKITVPDGYVLLTADAPEEVFRRLDKDPVGNSTEHRNRLLVGQIPHHGSEGSFQRSFWQNRYHAGGKAVISCGPNGYGHPSPAVLEKLNEIKYQVYRTDGHRPEKTSNQRRALESVSKARYPSSAPALEPVRFTC